MVAEVNRRVFMVTLAAPLPQAAGEDLSNQTDRSSSNGVLETIASISYSSLLPSLEIRANSVNADGPLKPAGWKPLWEHCDTCGN